MNLAASTGNVVQGNYIGTDITGSVAIGKYWTRAFGSAAGANGNLIGSNGDGLNDSGERNVISGNASNGVLLTAAQLTTTR